MNKTEMITLEDWQSVAEDVEQELHTQIQKLLNGIDGEESLEIQQQDPQIEHNALSTETHLKGRGVLKLSFAETITDVNVRLAAQKEEGRVDVYDSRKDQREGVLKSIESPKQAPEAVKTILRQVGQRALSAMLRTLDQSQKQAVVEVLAEEIKHHKETDSHADELSEPAFLTIGSTAGDYIASGDPWNLEFVLQTLNDVRDKLSKKNLDEIDAEIDLPTEAEEQFDWLSSTFSRYGYRLPSPEHPKSFIQRANPSLTPMENAEDEIHQAMRWEANQVKQSVMTKLSRRMDRFYEDLDREADLLE